MNNITQKQQPRIKVPPRQRVSRIDIMRRQRERLEKRMVVSSGTTNMALYGPSHSGKTWALATARLPLYVFSLDLNGGDYLKEKLGSQVIVNHLEQDNKNNPRQYKDFEAEFDLFVREGLATLCGTVAIDSMTAWTNAVMRQYIFDQCKNAKSVHKALDERANQADYGPVMHKEQLLITTLCSLPCDTIVTYHTHSPMKQNGQDVVYDGRYTLNCIGKNRDNIPAIIGNVFHMYEDPVTATFKLQTRAKQGSNKMVKHAQCRWRHKLNVTEEPNIRALLKKGGRPHEDKEISDWDELLNEEQE